MKNNDYFTDNPSILCPTCKERKFREYGTDRNGQKRKYIQCMTCTKEAWEKKFIKK